MRSSLVRRSIRAPARSFLVRRWTRPSVSSSLVLALLLAACSAPPPERIDAGRFGSVALFRPDPPPRALVFLFSDSAGLVPPLVREARALAASGVAVVGVDLTSYLAGLAASADGCHYVVGEIEALSQRLQRELGFAGYRSPILAGLGAGATLAEAALAQAPAATIGGALALAAAPSLATRVPLCAGAPSRPGPDGGFAYALPDSLPGTLIRVDRGPIAKAIAPLLAESAGAAGSALPTIEIPSKAAGPLLAVIWSGDGGWRDLDRTLGTLLAERGVTVVGVDSLRYFWRKRTPEEAAADLAKLLAARRAKAGAEAVLLVGYSFGADVLPAIYNRLPEAERARVVQLSLLGLAPTASFEFHVAGWLGAAGADDRPVLPELARIDPRLVQCVYGVEEKESLCPGPALDAAERIETKGGHHFDGNYRALAEKILAGAERRRALLSASPPP
jgi:type IV secretory pathway VirJ component